MRGPESKKKALVIELLAWKPSTHVERQREDNGGDTYRIEGGNNTGQVVYSRQVF